MRSLIARLLFAGVVGAVAAGCGTNGASQQTGALPNGNGGGTAPYVNAPAASATAAPYSVKPLLIDNGYEFSATPAASASPAPTPAYVYKGALGTSVSDVQVASAPSPDVLPTAAPAGSPTYPPSSFSHQLTFSGGGLAQVVFQFSKTVPDLVYEATPSAPTGAPESFLDYSTIVLHLAYAPSVATPPGTLSSVAVEITGSNAAGTFDVRVSCTGTPGVAPAFTRISCPKFPALNAVSNTVGPNPVLPGSLLGYDPVAAFAPKLNIVLNYTAPVPSTSTGNVMLVSDIYATQ
jgi:hypothetical protein